MTMMRVGLLTRRSSVSVTAVATVGRNETIRLVRWKQHPPKKHMFSSTSQATTTFNTSTSTSSNDAQRRAYEFYKQKGVLRSRTTSSSASASYTMHERNQHVAWYMVAVVVGAVGATYAAVPLYKIFCQATGFGGTTQKVNLPDWANQQEERDRTGISRIVQNFMTQFSAAIPEQIKAPSKGTRVHTWTDEEAAAKLASLRPVTNGRLLTIRFDSTVSDVLPWTFVPTQLDVKVVPGETALSFFTVTNHSDKPITGVATYNVYPPKAGLYFQKIQCFCFEEQRLLPGETVDMPVFFFVDPDFLQDSQLHHVNNLTLSYTFFQTDEEDLMAENDDDDDDDYDDDDENAAA